MPWSKPRLAACKAYALPAELSLQPYKYILVYFASLLLWWWKCIFQFLYINSLKSSFFVMSVIMKAPGLQDVQLLHPSHHHWRPQTVCHCFFITTHLHLQFLHPCLLIPLSWFCNPGSGGLRGWTFPNEKERLKKMYGYFGRLDFWELWGQSISVCLASAHCTRWSLLVL